MGKSIAKRIPYFSRLKGASWSDVESVDDLLRNILSRLPVKDLLPLKVVSKHWLRLIRNPSFTELHLSRSRENVIYILYPFMDEVKVLYLIDADGVATETITLPGFENLFFSMVCSSNGLICFTNYPWCPHSYTIQAVPEDLEIRICNPATHEIRVLPNCSRSEKELGLGVAFGPGTEYRVFRFFLSRRRKCEIFSSSEGTWKSIGNVKHTPMGAHHIFLNGKVYWFIASKNDHEVPGSILSVDMKNNFKIIKLPVEANAHSYLVDLEGCLSLVVSYDELDTVVVWILRDENKSDWEYKCSGDINYPCGAQCLDSVVARKNEVFFITQKKYHIFNTDEISWKELKIQEWLKHKSPMVMTYTESLLPCS